MSSDPDTEIDPAEGSDVVPALMLGQLMHDWNQTDPGKPPRALGVVDETLRDGLQSPSAHDPPIAQKIELLHLMAGLRIDCAALGYPAARERQYEDVLALAREIESQRIAISACCAARAMIEDIAPICEISQASGLPIQVGMFLGSSPIRLYAEGWELEDMLVRAEGAVSFAVDHGLSVLFVTEDTTRSSPEVLRQLYTMAIRAGAKQLCVADTVGHATPRGAAEIVRFVHGIASAIDASVGVDWHGHRDRGLDVANSFAAWEAGAQRCHGTALGMGERSGNTPIEQLLVNLQLKGWRDHDLGTLPEYVHAAASALGFTIPPNHPIVGRDAFRTVTGIHASALVKAHRKGEEWLSNRIYSGVSAGSVGRSQVIDIGPLSGAANVTHWLIEHGIEPEPGLVDALLVVAKQGSDVLGEDEILELVRRNKARVEVEMQSSGTHAVSEIRASADPLRLDAGRLSTADGR